jgi:hypothetical protein
MPRAKTDQDVRSDQPLEAPDVNKSKFRKFVHEMIHALACGPIISASVSWLTFAITFFGLLSSPKFANSRRVRASHFSLELKS